MSTVSDKKAACGFQVKATPRACSTCANFSADRVLPAWCVKVNANCHPDRQYTAEADGIDKNLRCKTHGFEVKKMSVCNDWTPAEETKTCRWRTP